MVKTLQEVIVDSVRSTLAKLGVLDEVSEKVGIVNYHLHNKSLCYPTLSDGITLQAPSTAWVLSDPVEIIPANAITEAFDVYFISVEDSSAQTDIYELILYRGASANIEIGRVRLAKQSGSSAIPSVSICCEIQLANTKISARLACSSGSRTIKISLGYHLEPLVLE